MVLAICNHALLVLCAGTDGSGRYTGGQGGQDRFEVLDEQPAGGVREGGGRVHRNPQEGQATGSSTVLANHVVGVNAQFPEKCLFISIFGLVKTIQ